MSGTRSAIGIRFAVSLTVLLCVVLAGWIGQAAWQQVGRPWAGFGMLPWGTVAPLRFAPSRSAAAVRDLRFNDRIVSIDGEPISGAGEVAAHAERVGPGVPVRYGLIRKSGPPKEVVVETTTFTPGDFLEICIPFLFGGLFGVGLGALVVFARPELAAARVFFLFNVGNSINFGLLAPDAYVTHSLPRFGFLAAGLASGAFLHLALLMPTARWPLTSSPRATLAAIYGTAVIATILLATRSALSIRFYLALFVIGAVGLVANVALTAVRGRDASQRRMARVLLPGLGLFGLSFLAFVAANVGWIPSEVSVLFFLLPVWILGVLSAYAIVAHNLFELDSFFRRALTVGIVALAAIALDLGLFAILRIWLEPAASWAVSGLSVVLLVAVIPASTPLLPGIEGIVERAFFPEQRRARRTMREASRQLARLHGEADLGRLLRDAIARVTTCEDVRLVVGERGQALHELAPRDPKSALELGPGDPLVAVIGRGVPARFGPVVLAARGGPSRAALQRAAEIEVRLAMPLPSGEPRLGSLLLGPRADGRPYTRDDELLLETLAAQAAVALENSRAWEEVRRLEQRLAAENLYLREEAGLAAGPDGETGTTGIVGRSPAVRHLLVQIEQVAPTDATILVEGETGTGKELVVRALHAASRRRDHVLVRIACAAVPETLLESELFGYERGAFTGAVGRRVGRFEVADGGTLFLDDVDTLPLGVQAKLLRAIQEGEVQRLGSNDLRRVDVRVVAATNRDLREEVRAGRFREDLYYRLNVVPLRIPPLRERAEDVPLLVEHFVREDGPRLGRTVKVVSAEALAALRAYRWPGNVRELRNVIQRALVLSRDEVLRLPGPLEATPPSGEVAASDAGDPTGPLADQVRDLKIRIIRRALAETGGNQRLAAERLGMHRQSLTRMIGDLGLRDAAAPVTAGTRRG